MQDEHLQKLQEYITQALAHHQTKEHIVHTLQSAGWPHDYIERAFFAERTAPVPPAPVRTQSSFDLPTALQKPLSQEVAVALGLGVVTMVIFVLFLPSPPQQVLNNLVTLYSGTTIPPVFYQIVITSFVLALVTSLVLTFRFKKKAAISPILVSLMAVFLALVAAQNRLVGLKFSLSLLITFPLAQVIWYYGRRWLIGRIIYFVAILGLLILSVHVLNVGSL